MVSSDIRELPVRESLARSKDEGDRRIVFVGQVFWPDAHVSAPTPGRKPDLIGAMTRTPTELMAVCDQERAMVSFDIRHPGR
jgi:hypothetical protein